MLRFVINLALIIAAGLLQLSTWFVFAGVKPNLVMALTLVIIIIDHNWFERLAFILVAELMLQFAPVPDIYNLIFLGLMMVSALVFDYLRLQHYLILGVTITLATIFIDVYGRVQWGMVLTEVAYNLVLVILIYTVINTFYGQKVLK